MNALEAAELVNIIKPKIAIPIHYGSIVGSKEDANTFVKNLNNKNEHNSTIYRIMFHYVINLKSYF